MRLSKSEFAEVDVQIVCETLRAICFRIEEKQPGEDAPLERWLPKSQIEIEQHDSMFATLRVPQWLAEKEGLV